MATPDIAPARLLLASGGACSSESLRRDSGGVAEMPPERGPAETSAACRDAGWP